MVALTPETRFRISIGAAFAAVLAAAGFGWRAQAILTSINENVKESTSQFSAKLDKLSTRLDSLETVMADRFTKTAAAEWALRLVIENPAIKVPDPREPSKTIQVGHEQVKTGNQSDVFGAIKETRR